MTANQAERMAEAAIMSAVAIISVAHGLSPGTSKFMESRFRVAVSLALGRCPTAAAANDDDDYCDLGAAAPGILEED